MINDFFSDLQVLPIAVQSGYGDEEATLKKMMKEIHIMRELNHTNIVRFLSCEKTDVELHIFLEYIAGGSVASLLKNYGALTVPVIQRYAAQMFTGLSFLHAQQICHRDIKGGNLLIDERGVLKLADFGASKILATTCTVVSMEEAMHGTANYMAPEAIKQSEDYDEKAADIWSAGCVVVEMSTGKPPWHEVGQKAGLMPLLMKIAESDEPPEAADDFPDDGKDLLGRCFHREPAQRAKAADLCKHAFVAEHCKDAALV